MYILIIVIHVVACFILIAAILLQAGRGGGLAGLFGGGATQTIFGARASTFLTRITTAAAIVFLLTCISLTVFSSRRGRSLLEQTSPLTKEPETEAVSQEIPEETQRTQEAPPVSEAESQIPQE